MVDRRPRRPHTGRWDGARGRVGPPGEGDIPEHGLATFQRGLQIISFPLPGFSWPRACPRRGTWRGRAARKPRMSLTRVSLIALRGEETVPFGGPIDIAVSLQRRGEQVVQRQLVP